MSEPETNPANEPLPSAPEPLRPLEGRYVLHVFYRWSEEAWQLLDEEEQEERRAAFARLVKEIRGAPDTQLLIFSVVSPKADWGFMLTTEDLHWLDQCGKRLGRVWGAGVCQPVYDYLSMTEKSEYTTTAEEFAETMRRDEGLDPDSPDGRERLAAFAERMAKYEKDRLYPNLADWPVVCFYPMSKRREPGQNWYALPLAERRELMKGHARVGRTYAGRIRQLITGSTGLDSMEWGVTLFAHNLSEIKNIVYEMRFDEVSAQFAEFGDFYIGLQMEPALLAERLGA
jgi:chlorite dismutase